MTGTATLLIGTAWRMKGLIRVHTLLILVLSNGVKEEC